MVVQVGLYEFPLYDVIMFFGGNPFENRADTNEESFDNDLFVGIQ
jgi:hypothetical protein